MLKDKYKNIRKKWYYFISAILLVMILSIHTEVSAAEKNAVKKKDFGGWEEGNAYGSGLTMSASGDKFATIKVDFALKSGEDITTVSYIEVYRATSEKGKYKQIGTIEKAEYGRFSFLDKTIDPMKNYYYYGIAYWKATDTTPAYYSNKSPVVSGFQGMAMPHFYTKGNGSKNIKLYFTSSGDGVPSGSFTIAQAHEGTETYFNMEYWTKIQIYRSTSKESGYKKIATIDPDKTSYTDKSVKKGKVYYYKTRGYYKNPKTGKVSYSAFTTPHAAKSGGKQNVDMNLEIKRLSDTSFKITWDKTDAYSEYEVIYQSNLPGAVWETGVVKSTKNKYYCTVKGLNKNDSYYIRVNARPVWSAPEVINGHATNMYYLCTYDTIFDTCLDAPQNVSYKLVSATLKEKNGIKTYTGKYKLTWDKVEGATGYRIYKTEFTVDGWKRVKIATCKGSSKTSVNITLKNFSGYIYVEAYKGSQTAENGVYVYKELKSPSASKIKIKKNGSKGTVISWSDMSKYGATSYKVYRYNERIDRSYLVGETTKTSIKDTKLKVKGTYTYLIVPCNSEFNIEDGGTFKKYTYK